MGQPEYVLTGLDEQPRRGLGLPPPRRWKYGRPGEIFGPEQPMGNGFGYPGPDQGYALLLARRFEERIEHSDKESTEDAVAGCVNVGLARAALFGRAPIIHDMTLAYTVWGFLGEAPPELVKLREPLFMEASHHYWDQRAIVDHVPEQTLRLHHDEVRRRFPLEWKALLGLS